MHKIATETFVIKGLKYSPPELYPHMFWGFIDSSLRTLPYQKDEKNYTSLFTSQGRKENYI